MKLTITANSTAWHCLGCRMAVSGGSRTCPHCGRVAVPPGDHLPAAAGGDEPAQFYVGFQCMWGVDVPRDLAEAEKWFRLSA